MSPSHAPATSSTVKQPWSLFSLRGLDLSSPSGGGLLRAMTSLALRLYRISIELRFEPFVLRELLLERISQELRFELWRTVVASDDARLCDESSFKNCGSSNTPISSISATLSCRGFCSNSGLLLNLGPTGFEGMRDDEMLPATGFVDTRADALSDLANTGDPAFRLASALQSVEARFLTGSACLEDATCVLASAGRALRGEPKLRAVRDVTCDGLALAAAASRGDVVRLGVGSFLLFCGFSSDR